MLMPRRWKNTPRPIPELYVFDILFFDFSTSVIPSFGPFIFVRFRQLQPLENSGPPPTEAQRLTIQTFFLKKNNLNSRESSYRIFRSKTSPNTHFQGGENSDYFINIFFFQNKTFYIFETQNLDFCVLKTQNLDLCVLKKYLLSFRSPEQVCTRPQGLFISSK